MIQIARSIVATTLLTICLFAIAVPAEGQRRVAPDSLRMIQEIEPCLLYTSDAADDLL